MTSGLGGMSGAQGKAGVITGCVAVIAEVDEKAIAKRHSQGWVLEVIVFILLVITPKKEMLCRFKGIVTGGERSGQADSASEGGEDKG